MAKGDPNRTQNQINNQGRTMQDSQNATMNQIYGQNLGFQNNYNTGVATDLNNQAGIMGNYQNIIDRMSGKSVDGAAPYGDEAAGYFRDFANSGGFSGSDIQDLRARAISPVRAVYSNAQNNLDQNRSLQQFSPNYAAATAKMAREMGYGMSDANVNANASIAGMRQQGKLAGAQGLAGIEGQNLQALLGATHGQAGLYGTTPGLSSTFGNQLLNSSNQLLQGNNQQIGMGLGLIDAQNNKGQQPSNYQQAMNNWKNTMNNSQQAMSMMGGMMGGMGGG
jgi:hypothetical protein